MPFPFDTLKYRTRSQRRLVFAKNGMVCSSQPLAAQAGLDILRRGGLMCVTVYSGGANGYEERDALIPFLSSLDDAKYQVLRLTFHNWKKDPPIPFFIIKL